MNGRMYDPILGRMLSPDNFVQVPTSSQSFNRYSYVWNNPLKYTDPSGEIAWFVPVAIGFAVGGYFGGVAASGEWNLVSSNYWKDGWEGFVVGGIAGAGIGLGVSYGAALAGAKITNASGASMFTTSSATSFTGWNIASNALITGNVNMVSRALQGGDLRQTATSGLVGVVAGAIGGAVASNMTTSGGHMSLDGIRTQNYITNAISGAGDRYFRSRDAGLSNGKIAPLSQDFRRASCDL